MSAVLSDEGTVDFIIVGGGTAGCILANRLSVNPAVRVALVEAGGEGRSPWIGIPAGFSKLLTGATYNWRFQTQPEESVHGRTLVVPRGKGLGGSTLINGMIYVRGQPQDFDGWAQRGCAGWSYDDVVPYFRKLENFADGDSERGHDGPVNLVRVSERHEIADAFIEAAVEAGFERNPDYNARRQDGFGYYQVTQKKGRRWSVVDAYLKPVRHRDNLRVFTHSHVSALQLEGRHVVGITFNRHGREFGLRAAREVVMAAGAVQTPQILELSGIGDPEVLRSHGVPVKAVLPGVGANYQDHFATRMNWRVSKPITINETSRGWRLGLAVANYALRRRGLLTIGTGMAHGFVRTRPDLEGPDVQYFFMHASYANAADRALDRQPGMTVGVTQLRPQSAGTIHIGSANPHEPPNIRPNFLADAIDQQTLVDGMKIARNIVGQPAMAPYRSYEMSPGDSVQSDADWLDFARRNGQTIYHPVGTCRMGRDPMAVVDERLNVHGLRGIRIADASVMPTVVSANTQAAVMMVAEKAAEMILEDARPLAARQSAA